MNRDNIPDYVRDKFASAQLAKRIENYYRNKGIYTVKAWVEEIPLGDQIYYGVRSNIHMDVRDVGATI